jgi:hypothetical protein
MKIQAVGRKEEKKVLHQALQHRRAEMIAVTGRRRVGKTFLIKNEYSDNIAFEITGVQNAPMKEQLENFANKIKKISGSKLPVQIPKSWLHAFALLTDYLETLDFRKKKVLFFDELPWMATHRSRFLTAFGSFWNSWAETKNIVVVICGSAASWMIKKVVKDRGGLHNRITKRILLKPFTLAETKQFLESRKIHFNHYQIIQLYLALGGVPHYLKEVKGNKSAVQNIDNICFSDTGLLKDEFSNLYHALFENADNHIAIIRTLAMSPNGLNRNKIVAISKLPEGGSTSHVLTELEQSGFISAYYPFGKRKKDMLYRLTDEYSLFYLRFMESKKHDGRGTWQHLSQSQKYKTWSGYAFESLCLKHIPQIKKALGIAGVYSLSSTFLKKGTREEKGVQIDLLIDRDDQIINVFEIKFSNQEYALTKNYADTLRKKLWVFRETTKTRKLLFLTMITTFGLKVNQHSLGQVQQSLTMDALFED